MTPISRGPGNAFPGRALAAVRALFQQGRVTFLSVLEKRKKVAPDHIIIKARNTWIAFTAQCSYLAAAHST